MATRVYLGDLRYNTGGVLANDCMPLGVAYMKAVMDRDNADTVSRLFVYPDRLMQALRDDPPDVLMLSNYVWNEALSRAFFRLAKQANPNVLTVMGGPNIPIEPDRQIAYVDQYPEIDVYITGEADFAAAQLVSVFQDCGLDHKVWGKRGMESTIWRNPEGQLVRSATKPRHREVNEIPSPWLTGIQDEFFDGRLAPMIETNRGCPFTCTFCAQGTSWYTKVHNFDVERMKEEIHYIARRIKERSPKMGTLRIADSNYGMFERDIDISGYIGQMQRDYGWPTFIDATTGKNRPERIIKSVEQVSGALVLYQAVQSLDENVLRKIKRDTIKLDAYKALEVHMRGRGLKSISDLILGLPGESLETHLHGLTTLLDSNIDQMHNFQAMMLKGSEMEKLESRETFKFDTRFRVLPRNFGVFEDRKVFDVEEIIVATDTLPFEDYITCRKYHLISSVFWNDGWFAHVVAFCRAHGITNAEWWKAMLPALEEGDETVRGFLDAFVGETKGELFPTRDACIDFYAQEENFQKLGRGDIGDNLMYRYRAIASFFIWDAVCDAAMKASRALLDAKGVPATIPDFDRFWADFHSFIRLIHATGLTEEEILAPTEAVLHYDFPAWIASGDWTGPAAFRLEEPQLYRFELTEEGEREMRMSLATWTTHIRGLSKLVTRIRVESQVRQCLPADGSAGMTRRAGVIAAE
ncbi:cobalamin-dependent protein [Roseomonas sp. HJA6]|uniref:Cobalamin-dependent protein n=1 Tax=Roseomonas alba TaxID=2846776 RepID=A0ABS7A403_9PROT|nr:radical SAM protein [Neoroseomonas alba]MBW6396970.1 cobalamin-dependent protein [Neoroseomonas alba]